MFWLRPEHVGAPVELRDVGADAIVFGEIPVAKNLTIAPHELHVWFEQAAGNLATGRRTVGHSHEVMKCGWFAVQDHRRAGRLELGLRDEAAGVFRGLVAAGGQCAPEADAGGIGEAAVLLAVVTRSSLQPEISPAAATITR